MQCFRYLYNHNKYRRSNTKLYKCFHTLIESFQLTRIPFVRNVYMHNIFLIYNSRRWNYIWTRISSDVKRRWDLCPFEIYIIIFMWRDYVAHISYNLIRFSTARRRACRVHWTRQYARRRLIQQPNAFNTRTVAESLKTGCLGVRGNQ